MSTILIIGGTTEGRMAVKVCEEAAQPYYYSTKGEAQQVEMAHGSRISGGMDANEMALFCREHEISLIVDAAHPFAMGVHTHVGMAAAEVGASVVRVERKFPSPHPDAILCDNYPEAVALLTSMGCHRLLALTGVNTIAPLAPFWRERETFFRIMDRDDSREVVRRNDFPPDHLLYYDTAVSDAKIFSDISPDCIITKESGESGGYIEKVETALSMGIPVVVVRRPVLPYSPTEVVYGHYGLRRAIERLLPTFFPLRTGYTTGTCATAATVAALTTLLSGEAPTACTLSLPNGEPISIPIEEVVAAADRVTATVIKVSGDDPDVTNGTEICAMVQLAPDREGVHFLQGRGVGVVTLPGLGLEVGGPAINKTPREMMRSEVTRLLTLYELDPNTGVEITLSVPQGEELALRTFNPKIGVIGGISIIGTSGIVKPFSSEAFVNSIKAELRVAHSLGAPRLVLNSGAKSERYIKALYPELPSQAFVHYGNFIGETLQAAHEVGFSTVTMGVMIGKAVKLAEGILDTHSKKSVMNKEFLLDIARQAHSTPEQQEAMAAVTLAREIWGIIPPRFSDGTTTPFYRLLLARCHTVCDPLLLGGSLTIYFITEEGEIIG